MRAHYHLFCPRLSGAHPFLKAVLQDAVVEPDSRLRAKDAFRIRVVFEGRVVSLFWTVEPHVRCEGTYQGR